MNFYEGVLVLISYKSLSEGSTLSKIHRNVVRFFDLGFLSTLNFIMGNYLSKR